MNKTEKYQWQDHPFEEFPVWEKGFRRIYTQNSYYFRPGNWLVLKLRDNAAGRKVRQHVQETFPPERMGAKVPLPREAQLFLDLREVRGGLKNYAIWLQLGERKPKLLLSIQELAEEILQDCPHLFAGDDAYLWEEMARNWEDLGELDKAAHCLYTQAKLQPGKTDAWLNLGALYRQAKSWGSAVEANLRGLRFDPDDRYLKSNLNGILANESATAEALDYFDFLVEYYPDPFNLLIAGDLLRLLGKYGDAEERYQQGANLGEPGNRARLRCLTGLADIYLADKNYDQAKVTVERALETWSDDAVILEMAVQLYLATGDYAKLKACTTKLVQVQPNSVPGHRALARTYLAEGNTAKAKQYAARAKKLAEG